MNLTFRSARTADLMGAVFHFHSREDEELVRNIGLFQKLGASSMEQLMKSIRRVRVPAGRIVFREGEPGDALYIIKQGAVQVYTLDANEKKVPLARLGALNYFGEQSLIDEIITKRTASVEALSDCILIRIEKKFFRVALGVDNQLAAKLKDDGYRQVVKELSAASTFFKSLQQIDPKTAGAYFIEYADGKVIFSYDDPSDAVYFIVNGAVELLIPTRDTHQLESVFLHKGHILGEMGVMHGKPRTATAIARKNLRLMVMSGAAFNQLIKDRNDLIKLTASLQRVYQLPKRGSVERYVGKISDFYTTITNVFKMDDGRSITSSTALEFNLFSMEASNDLAGQTYRFKTDNTHIELGTVGNRLVHISALGEWFDLPVASQALLENIEIDESIFRKFEITGRLDFFFEYNRNESQKFLCDCLSITRDKVQCAIDAGASTIDELSNQTGVCTVCKCCKNRVLEMLGEKPWLPASMKKSHRHTDAIASYRITLLRHQFGPYFPGQHVVLNANINGHWIERAYTISDVIGSNCVEVTVKREPGGYFTGWLFDQGDQDIDLQVSHPEGDFILRLDINQPALCFAGGIGITPFIAFLRSLVNRHTGKQLQVIYCASNESEFVLKSEMNAWVKDHQHISVTFRCSSESGRLTPTEVMDLVRSTDNAEVYICGSTGFENMIRDALANTTVDPARIYSEKFLHVSPM